MISIVAEADLAGGLSATRKQPQISPAKIVALLSRLSRNPACTFGLSRVVEVRSAPHSLQQIICGDIAAAFERELSA